MKMDMPVVTQVGALEFKANKYQKAYVRVLSEPGGYRSREDVAQEIGVPADTIDRWHGDDQFLLWVEDEMERQARKDLPLFWRDVREMVKKGASERVRLEAAKLYAFRFDPKIARHELDVIAAKEYVRRQR